MMSTEQIKKLVEQQAAALVAQQKKSNDSIKHLLAMVKAGTEEKRTIMQDESRIFDED